MWGPPLWEVLHYIAFNYPTQPTRKDAENYRAFFLSLRNVLPCRICREHFTRLVTTPGPLMIGLEHLRSRASFARYVYDLHARVTRDILVENPGVRTITPTFSSVVNRYEGLRRRPGAPKLRTRVSYEPWHGP